jgi:purine nucleosidase
MGIDLKVDLDGPFRGRTIGDRDRLRDSDKTTQVAIAVDAARFEQRFMERITALAARY